MAHHVTAKHGQISVGNSRRNKIFQQHGIYFFEIFIVTAKFYYFINLNKLKLKIKILSMIYILVLNPVKII